MTKIRTMKYIKLMLVISFVISLSACVKDKEESSREIQERILDAYIATNYPNAEKKASGLTILEMIPGSGNYPQMGEGCYIHYDTYNLAGVCQSTTDSLVAKQLGTYMASNYYGPTLFVLSDYYTTNGMIELLQLLNKGSEVSAIIPPWLTSTNSRYSSVNSNSQQSAVNTIYKIKMGAIVPDIIKYQIDSLESYSAKYFSPAVDSTEYGFYFKNFTHPSGIPEADTVEANTNINLWYIGRLLDGYVFDTNIADTAKKYGIYSSTASYTPLSVKILTTADVMFDTNQNAAQDATTSASSSSSKLIYGMCKSLKKMTIGDHATAFFTSGLGYGADGNMSGASGVPPYAMLRFDMWMTSNSDSNYPPAGYR